MNKQTKQNRNSTADLGLLYFSVIVACWYHLGVYLGCETEKTKRAFCAPTELASCQPLSSIHIQEDIFITLPCVQTQEPEQTALLNLLIFSSPSQTKCIIKYREVQTWINLGNSSASWHGRLLWGDITSCSIWPVCLHKVWPVIVSWGCDLPMNETDGLGLARGVWLCWWLLCIRAAAFCSQSCMCSRSHGDLLMWAEVELVSAKST